jgi:thymidylate kinase
VRVSVSGIDGSGKTSLCRALCQWLTAAGWPTRFQKLQPRAYQRPAGAEIIDLADARPSGILFNLAEAQNGHPGFAFTRFSQSHLEYLLALEEVLMFRREAEPFDNPDSFVVHDRHLLDRRAGAALAGCPPMDIEAILGLIRPPDVALLLDLPAEMAEARLLGARGQLGPDENREAQAALREAYLQAAARDPAARVLDATRPMAAVLAQAVSGLRSALPALDRERS